jgi:GNAT superfamily N-acetyltransferase
LADVDPASVARRIGRDAGLDLPWQLAAETLLKLGTPSRGLSLDDRCFALVTSAAGCKLALRALYVPPEQRRQGLSARMLAAIAGRFPEHAISTPVAVPAALAPVFTGQGFQPIAITQEEMALALR